MAGAILAYTVRKWGNSGGVTLPKELIGKRVYVMTEEDVNLFNRLNGGNAKQEDG